MANGDLRHRIARREDLAGTGERADARRGVYALAPVVGPLLRRLRLVQSDPHLRREAMLPSVLAQRPLHRHGTLDRVAGAVEGHEEAVTDLVDLAAVMRGEALTQRLVVPPEQVLPCIVADRLDEVGRAHYVGEHERLRHSCTRRGCARDVVGQLLAEQLHGRAQVEHRPKAIESRLGGLELELAAVLVAVGP
jgi:hypothetical protein